MPGSEGRAENIQSRQALIRGAVPPTAMHSDASKALGAIGVWGDAMSDTVPPGPPTGPIVDENPPTLSLTVGGPWYRLCLKLRLARVPLHLWPRRVAVIVAICWLPPFVLSAIAGQLTSGGAGGFLFDPDVQVRLLLALPLLIAWEVYVDQRSRLIIGQFTTRGLIAPSERVHFCGILDSTARLRDAWAVELALLVLAASMGHRVWLRWQGLGVTSWYAASSAHGLHLTAAGIYYAWGSLVIGRFILYRWLFRLLVWYWLLWRVRSLPLRLNLYHPDRCAGLGFLGAGLALFAPVFAALDMVYATFIFSHILHTANTLHDFEADILTVVIILSLVLIAPMFFYFSHLEAASRRARAEFGIVASRYVDAFRWKWVEGGSLEGGAMLGSPDLQSLADLANSYAVAARVQLLPVSRRALVGMVVTIALPFLPLALTILPFTEAVRQLVKVVL